MRIKFGNLTVRQFLERVESEMTDTEIDWLESYRTDVAMFTDQSKFHIFDDPAITVNIGTAALADTQHVWMAANKRKPFNRPVSFYPVTRSEGADDA